MDNDREKDKNSDQDKNQQGGEQKPTQGNPDNREDEDLPAGVKKPLSRIKKIVLAAGGFLLLLLLAAGTYVMAFYSEVRETERVLLEDVSFEEKYDIEVDAVFSERIVNIALLGFDRGWNREAYGEYLFRPDMLAVFSVNFGTDEISVVRVPRDSYVPIHGTGGFHDKINHSYYFGYRRGGGEDNNADGISYTLQTLSNTLGGIPIHYYVSVDMYSVIELVDAIGGIYYEVEEEIIDKHWEIGRILVPEGPQIMDGKTFLRYLQYRDAESSQDIGRIDRQMNLLKQSFLYLREQGRITDIPATYRIYKDYVDTDLTYTQIAALAYYARDIEVAGDTLNFYTVPGSGQMKDGVWYQVINQDARLEIIEEVFGIEAGRWPPIVLEDSPEYIEEQERKEREERELGTDPGHNEEPGEAEETDGPAERDQDAAGGIAVPDVKGLDLEEAKSLLRESGFTIGEVTTRAYIFLEEGLVINSRPLYGSVSPAGTAVSLVVSEGPEDDE